MWRNWVLSHNSPPPPSDTFNPQNLYLNSAYPQWWQFITCTFCHFDWAHLSQNAFFLLVFGRLVEEEEGSFGVWATYLLCGIGGAVAAHLLGGCDPLPLFPITSTHPPPC